MAKMRLPEHELCDRLGELDGRDERDHAHSVDGSPDEHQAGRGAFHFGNRNSQHVRDGVDLF